ncbi:TetR/AcrR family transcriptional regulator [soil metagenome]
MVKSVSAARNESFRDRLLETAEMLLIRRGVEKFAMRQLGAALGVSTMTAYHYFKSKDEILAAVCASNFDRMATLVERRFDPSEDAADNARAAAKLYRDFALEHPVMYRLMFDLAPTDQTLHPDLLRANTRLNNALLQFFYRLLEEGLIAGDPNIAANAMWATMHGLVILKMAGKLAPDLDMDHVWDETYTALTIGFRHRHNDVESRDREMKQCG